MHNTYKSTNLALNFLLIVAVAIAYALSSPVLINFSIFKLERVVFLYIRDHMKDLKSEIQMFIP